jgi:hypothetical protein
VTDRVCAGRQDRASRERIYKRIWHGGGGIQLRAANGKSDIVAEKATRE